MNKGYAKENGLLLLGDAGYVAPDLNHFVMTPLVDPKGIAQKNYNFSHIRTRNLVERSFGLLKNRFRILYFVNKVKMDKVQEILVACAVLHNIINGNDANLRLVYPEHVFSYETEIKDLNIHGSNTGVRDNLIANHFGKYHPAFYNNINIIKFLQPSVSL